MHHLCGVLENLQVKHVWTNMINSYNIFTNEEVYFLLLECTLGSQHFATDETFFEKREFIIYILLQHLRFSFNLNKY